MVQNWNLLDETLGNFHEKILTSQMKENSRNEEFWAW